MEAASQGDSRALGPQRRMCPINKQDASYFLSGSDGAALATDRLLLAAWGAASCEL